MGNSNIGIVGRLRRREIFWPMVLIVLISLVSIAGLFAMQRQLNLVASRDLPAISFAANLERSARELDLAVTDLLSGPMDPDHRKNVILAHERLTSVSADWPFGMQDQRLRKISDHVAAIVTIADSRQSNVTTPTQMERHHNVLRDFRGDLRGFHGFSAALLSGSSQAIQNAQRTAEVTAWAVTSVIFALILGVAFRAFATSGGGANNMSRHLPERNHQASLGGGPTVLANQEVSSAHMLAAASAKNSTGGFLREREEHAHLAAAFRELKTLLAASDIRPRAQARKPGKSAVRDTPEMVRERLMPLMACLENMSAPLQRILSTAHRTNDEVRHLAGGLVTLKRDQDGRENWTIRARLLAKNASLGHANWENLPRGYLKEFAHEANALFVPWEASTARLEKYGADLEVRLAHCLELSDTGCVNAQEIQTIAASLPKLIAQVLETKDDAVKVEVEPASRQELESWAEKISSAVSEMQASIPGPITLAETASNEYRDHAKPNKDRTISSARP